MAIKKEMKAWAIKLRGRSFYQNNDGLPFLFESKRGATFVALKVQEIGGTLAAPIRVKIKIEEV